MASDALKSKTYRSLELAKASLELGSEMRPKVILRRAGGLSRTGRAGTRISTRLTSRFNKLKRNAARHTVHCAASAISHHYADKVAIRDRNWEALRTKCARRWARFNCGVVWKRHAFLRDFSNRNVSTSEGRLQPDSSVRLPS